jgi:hypothetical protein
VIGGILDIKIGDWHCHESPEAAGAHRKDHHHEPSQNLNADKGEPIGGSVHLIERSCKGIKDLTIRGEN